MPRDGRYMYVHSTGRFGKHQVTVLDCEELLKKSSADVWSVGTWSFWFGFNAGRFRIKT